MKLLKHLCYLLALSCGLWLTACGDDDPKPTVTPDEPSTETPSEPESPEEPGESEEPEEPTYDMTGFARGADVSWLTEMEEAGRTWKTADGEEMECLTLLRELGMNAIRLRVWVNPENGWCGQEDVLVKARRAKDLGFRLMIDFHYSDSWADPGKQYKPAAWENYSFDELKAAIAEHTQSVLKALKDESIDVEWVQVGNEIRGGMLWDEDPSLSGASYDVRPCDISNDTSTEVLYPMGWSNLAAYINTGYDAVKSVFPDASVIVHLDNGYDSGLYEWFFDELKNNGAKWDLIGMSLYPDEANNDWKTKSDACLQNMTSLKARYSTNCMVCEIGYPWDASDAEDFLTYFMTNAKSNAACEGVFYWEPECYYGWERYPKGMFDDNGRATSAFNAFSSDTH